MVDFRIEMAYNICVGSGGLAAISGLTQYYQHHAKPRLKRTSPRGERGFAAQRKDLNMKYTIVFTHNPQDFFEGIEPDDLIVVREATNEELQSEIVPMVDVGYKAIVFQAGE